MKGTFAAVSFVAALAGFVTGYIVRDARPPAPSDPAFSVGAFHKCLAEYEATSPRYRTARRDSAAMQRAVALFAVEGDCANTSGVAAFNGEQIQIYSGFRLAPPSGSAGETFVCEDATPGKPQAQALPRCAL